MLPGCPAQILYPENGDCGAERSVISVSASCTYTQDPASFESLTSYMTKFTLTVSDIKLDSQA